MNKRTKIEIKLQKAKERVRVAKYKLNLKLDHFLYISLSSWYVDQLGRTSRSRSFTVVVRSSGNMMSKLTSRSP